MKKLEDGGWLYGKLKTAKDMGSMENGKYK